MTIPLLAIAGSLCYVAALLLPAIQGRGGFLNIGGSGWKILWISMVLMAFGFVALFKETNDKIWFYFIPGVINILMVLLVVLGLLSVHGDGMRMLGVVTLMVWGFLFFLMLFKMRSDLQIGSYFWCAACLLLSINALRG
ncbi:MAG: hypothetical protein IPP19_02220 [Verrucomicrobia bacterium]|nr:hypothetical protein [Verrucomicrobiota bacterium]